MGRIHLMHQKSPEVWYLLEEDVDYIGASHNGKPLIMDAECVYSADSLWDMLHQMQNNKDWRFYVVHSWIDSKHRWRDQEYPHHRHICSIAGFIPEVCDIRLDDNPYLADWKVDFCRELWVCELDGEHMYKVRGWKKKAGKAAFEYIKGNKLKWEEEYQNYTLS